jgi:FkbH-like protein
MEVEIAPATGYSIPRIAQLTQKTNQWNMTTRRYTEAQIQRYAVDPAFRVFSASVRDRFGSHGIVGVIIIGVSRPIARIDTFLMSCRVIGRGIESLMLSYAADQAREAGCSTLLGEFIPTAKNAPAAGFYAASGLRKMGETEFVAELKVGGFPAPSHIRLTAAAPRAAAGDVNHRDLTAS